MKKKKNDAIDEILIVQQPKILFEKFDLMRAFKSYVIFFAHANWLTASICARLTRFFLLA